MPKPLPLRALAILLIRIVDVRGVGARVVPGFLGVGPERVVLAFLSLQRLRNFHVRLVVVYFEAHLQDSVVDLFPVELIYSPKRCLVR